MALIPLPDFVHFPKTELHLEFDANDRELAEAIIAHAAPGGLALGTTLLKPPWAWRGERPEIFSAGTAVQLVEHHVLTEGGYRVVLHGEHRFELTEEALCNLDDGPLREARVRRLEEPYLSDVDPAILDLRDDLMRALGVLAHALGGRFPIDAPQLTELEGTDVSFEGLVNAVASALDLSPFRKQSLLADTLLERAMNLRGILRSRVSMMELLQPFQHLAQHAEHN